jgi:CRP-like cAMP-binding protein
MEDESFLHKVKLICKKKPNDRSPAEILELQDLTRNSKVFQNIIELSGETAHQICCKFLSYEFCASEHYLFNIGDTGTCFYLILSGKVGIEIPKKDELTGEFKMSEVVELGKGASFGELALESSKPRQASVKCKVNSHFLTLEKADYNRMIAKVVRDKRNNVVTFLKTLPIFSGITKGSLAKLTYNFKEKEFFKNQVVYKEGEAVNEVFLVTEGEFLFQKKIVVQDGRKKNAIYNECYSDNVEIVKFRSKALQKNLVQVANIAKVGVGELFGVEENQDEVRRFSCICNSQSAKVLCILKADFYKRVKGEDTVRYIQEKILVKEMEIQSRVAMWKFIAEDTASSLSPLQIRRRNKEVEQVLREETKTPPPFQKNSTVQVFSKKQDNFSNIFLYKQITNDLRSTNPPLSLSQKSPLKQKSSSKPSPTFPKLQTKFLSKYIPKSDRGTPSPIRGSGHLAVSSLNSKAIYEALNS